jgi:hypothetical protein
VNGNTAQMDTNNYDVDGVTVASKGQNTFLITTGTSFNGASGLTEIRQTNNTTQVTGPGAGTTVGPSVTKSYFNYGAVDTLTYGSVSTVSLLGFSVVTTSVYTPAAVWPTNPILNSPYTRTVTLKTDISGLGPTTSTTTTQTETFTFSAETVSTFVGTFQACKVRQDVTANGSTTTSYSWTVGTGRLKGHLLKSTNATGVRTTESTVLTVNGS